MKKLTQYIVFSGIILSIAGCGERAFVARIGNKVVNLQEFRRSFLSDKGLMQAPQLSFDIRLEHLNQMIDNRLKLMDAYRMGLDRDEEIRNILKTFETDQVKQAVIEKEVIDKVLPDRVLRERYRQQSRELKIRQIFRPLSREADDSKKNLEFDILSKVRLRIVKGEDFDKLAREFSKDSLTAGKGGEIGFIKWDSRSLDREIIEAAFSLEKGDISPIVQTDKGLYILFVEKEREVAQPPFDDIKEDIRRVFYREKRDELDKTYNEFTRKLRKLYSYSLMDENVDYLAQIYRAKQPDSLAGKEGRYTIPNIGADLTEADRAKSLMKWNGGKYTIGQFVDRVDKVPPFRRPPLYNVSRLKSQLERTAPHELMVQWGYDRGYQHHPEIKEKCHEKREAEMIRKVNDIQVFQQVKPEEEDIKKYFAENADKYVVPAKVSVQEIYVRDAQLAQRIARMAKTSSDFDALAKRYHERAATKEVNGKTGFITEYQYGAVGKKAILLEKGATAGPIQSGRGYSVIKILDKLPEKPQPYEEAKGRVAADLRRKLQTERDEAWIKDLRATYPVYIYEGVLRNVFPQSS